MAAVGGSSAGAEQAPRIVVEEESVADKPEAGFEIVSKQSVDVKDVEKRKEDNTENVEDDSEHEQMKEPKTINTKTGINDSGIFSRKHRPIFISAQVFVKNDMGN